MNSMYGVIGLYCDYLMFGVNSKHKVYLTMDDSNFDHYKDLRSRPLKVFKTNSSDHCHYKLPENILKDTDEFLK